MELLRHRKVTSHCDDVISSAVKCYSHYDAVVFGADSDKQGSFDVARMPVGSLLVARRPGCIATLLGFNKVPLEGKLSTTFSFSSFEGTFFVGPLGSAVEPRGMKNGEPGELRRKGIQFIC